ncbi:RtcB family protein [Candidatus Methanomassiliicoccus intestinalis]|uniref:RtcB family protein n=1 Tax=Candidatus Methanomassiliicoccus intestinalis TaxID=1406512 RepID=UPI0037DC4950
MSYEGPLEKIDDFRWKIPRGYKSGMNTDAVIYSGGEMLQALREDDAPEQAANVSCLPGIVGNSLAMPDIHWGYGFPIGGVAAMDADEGVISPGGIGFDINCGVRLVRTDLEIADVQPHIKELISALFKNVPSGVGSEGLINLTKSQIDEVLLEGGEWAVRNGYGWDEDLLVTEEEGRMKNADPSKVSDKSRKRGIPQLGSLGSGNHFLEVDYVEDIFDEDAAKAFGLRKGQITVTVHCGSRGCGHQIATDYLQVMERNVKQVGLQLPDRQLACAPVNSKDGENYFKAMACGANYAWANRQMILHWIRESFEECFKRDAENMGMHQVYDVAHNIAKLEEHNVDGQRRKVYVHRKGATRAFPKEHPEIPSCYSSVGQPVLIPGDMGHGSYVLVGTECGMAETFGSTCHGAGRIMSRSEAIRKFTVQGIKTNMEGRGIFLKSATKDGILEEAPDAYKSIENVIDVVAGAGLSKKVAKLVPLGVMKG